MSIAADNGGASHLGDNGGRGTFAEDDYDEINCTYFDSIFRSTSWSALPAGWHNPHCEAASMFEPCAPDKGSLQQYTLDEGYALEEAKSAILALVSTWEERTVDYNQLTLCPSVSTANLLVLSALKAAGFETIIFETQCILVLGNKLNCSG